MAARPILVWLPVGIAVVAAGFAVSALAADTKSAPYTLVQTDGAFEIRDYPARVVAEVRGQGSREATVGTAFRALFDYISGKDRSGAKIAMTTPVTQSPTPIAMTAPVGQSRDADGGWTVAFVMPAGSTLETLPPPASDAVTLRTQPPQRVAAIRFSGRWTDAAFTAKTAELMQWISSRGLKPAGEPTYAYYNAPFTPWFLRHNEVLEPIAR